MANKLTRKELVQEDVIRKTLTETSSWAVENLKLIALVVLLVIVGSLAVWGWRTWSEYRTEKVQTALAEALAIYHGEIRAADAGPDTRSAFEKPKYSFTSEQERNEKALQAFQAVVEDYSGTVAELAQYYVAVISYEMGQADEARRAMREVVNSAGSADIRNLARNALSQYLAAAGQKAESTALLDEILQEPSPNFPVQFALMALAKAEEEGGNLNRALELYRKVSAEHAGTPAASEAEERIRRLEFLVQETEQPQAEASAESRTATP